MLNTYFFHTFKNRWLIVIGFFIIIGIIATGITELKFTSSYKVFFKPDNPYLLALERVENTYVKNENILISIASPEKSIFQKDTLQMLRKFTKQAWQTPFAVRVDSLSNYQHTYADQDELIVSDLINKNNLLNQKEIEQIKRIALTEPLLTKWVISADGKTTGINITLQLPGLNESTETPQAAKYIRELTKQYKQQYPALDFYITGGVMLNNAFAEASKNDIKKLVPFMYLMITLGLLFFFRSFTATLAILIIVFLSILASLGVAGWLNIQLSPPSASAPNIILTIAIADCVHFYASFFYALQQNKQQSLPWLQRKKNAIRESLDINLKPIFITSLTTAIGFLSMNFSDSPPFHDLGNIVAIGVATAFVLSISFLPALAAILPVKTSYKNNTVSPTFSRLGKFVVKKRHILLLLSIAISLTLITLIPNNQIDDDSLKYFSTNNKFRQDTEFTTKHLTGLYSIDYPVPALKKNGINHPNYLNNLEKFVQWLRKQPEVIHVYSVSDIFKRLNKNLHDDNPEYFKMPETQEMAAQYLLLYEMSLPFGMDINDRINIDKSESRITVRIKTMSSKEVLAFDKHINQWMTNNLPKSMIKAGTGGNIIFANIGVSNIKEMLKGTTISFLIVSFVIFISLRSFKLGLLSLIPNMIPAALAFGVWSLIDGQINMGIAAVTALTVGIVVDDTVHFLSKYQYAQKKHGLNSHQSVTFAFNHVGNALWITSIILIGGFLVLTLSDFALNAKLGLLTAITIIFALLADFFLLPALLMLREPSKKTSK